MLPAHIKEGLFGGGVSFGFTAVSVPLERVNALLTMASLVIGITVGLVTLYRFFRHRDTKDLVAQVNQIARGLGHVEMELFVMNRRMDMLVQHTGCPDILLNPEIPESQVTETNGGTS